MSDGISFKKFSAKNKFARKRQKSSSSESSGDDQETAVVRKANKLKKTNPNVFRTTVLETKAKKHLKDNQSDSGSGKEDDEVAFAYRSSRTAGPSGPSDQGATAIVEIDTERDRDAQAIFEKRMEVNKELEGKEDDKVYRGLNNYAQYYKKKDSALGNASSGLVRQGPIRAPAHLRATVRWDYQPDICKDYKETGFCGFGDSCKFLHDRSDYKAGWQLETEYSDTKRGSDDDGDDDTKYEIPSDEEELPFKCFICRESFVDPIVTKCKHYFCEKCALENYKKSKRCFNCGIQTNGMFNPAKELIVKLKQRAKEEEIANENEDSDEQD